jgi:hypothetical protein
VHAIYRLGTVAIVLLVAALGAKADVFRAGGKVLSEVVVKNEAADCTLPKGTKFDLAPSPASSASAPVALVSVTDTSGGVTTPSPCPTNKQLTISVPKLDSTTKYEEWTIGAAVVPFKYYSTGNKGVATNTSAIGYLGYKWHAPGGGFIFGVGGGPASIAVPNTSGAAGATTQVTGVSTAVFLLGQIGYNTAAQFGIAVGRDKVSESTGWVNNGKTWIGFQIGAKVF